jgi:acid phosphatase type 7
MKKYSRNCPFSFLLVIYTVFQLVSVQLNANTRYYRLSYRDDPSTTVVIGWSDNGTSTNAMVYYGTTDLGTNAASYPFSHGIDNTTSYVSLTNHFARLTGLTPDTKYYFVVKDDQGVSARYSFKTITDNPDGTITFIAGGDSRTKSPLLDTGTCTGGDCRVVRQNANRLVAKIRPDFVSFNGDFVLTSILTSYWTDWFTDWALTYGPDADGGLIVPFMPATGNHEVNADIVNLFDVTNANDYYAISFGGNLFRFYSLNVIANGIDVCADTAQTNWFTNDLNNYTGTSSEPYWKFCQYHTPMAPHALTYPNQHMIDCWASLFQSKKVSLCLEGHSHVLKYTWPIVPSSGIGSDNGFIRDDVNGTVYIGEGAWGAPVRDLYTTAGTTAYNWTRDQASTDGFHLICVTKQKIEIRTVKFDVVATVGQVAPGDPECTLPANLSIWTPSNGAVVEINNPSIGIYENTTAAKKIDIYPNPANDFLTFSSTQNISNAYIEMYNGMGMLMKKQKISFTDNNKISTTNLSDGAYFIFIKADNFCESQKILISH